MRQTTRRIVAIASWIGATSGFICGFTIGPLAQTPAPPAPPLKIEVLSSRPDLISGGDALVRITGAQAKPQITLAGKDISQLFQQESAGGWLALVSGLNDGDNTLNAQAANATASLTLVNHPINGPLFAGPQQTPFLCENEAFGLTPAKDESCAAATLITYYYRNRAGDWKLFNPTEKRPSDLVTVKTTEGKSVPLIVRQERGVINRAAYMINLLHDPANGALPNPLDRSASSWNGKLVYGFGPGVGTGYHMGRNYGHWSAPSFFIESLGRDFDAVIAGGYAMASSSLNVFGTMPNDVLSAESAAKVKEHFIKQFGVPLFTIGQGTSGGSMQQNLIANAYPGILDAITPNQLYSDTMTFLQPLYDCELLVNVFKGGNYTREQMQAVAGKYWGYCISNGTRYPTARSSSCDPAVAEMVEGNAALKAKGIRCTFQDNLVNIFGTDPASGVARNPFDNVGVQYGLKALNDGKLTMAQFIDINGRIGGHDQSGKIVAQRQIGDELAIKRAYETGRVNLGTGNYANVPVVGTRTYADGDPFGRGDPNVDVHDAYHTAILQARLNKYNGSDANFVYLLGATGSGTINNNAGTPTNLIHVAAFEALDKWLSAMAKDTSNRTKAEKVVANKPEGFVNACYAAKGGFDITAIERSTDMQRCAILFPTMTSPRNVAGGPGTEDIFKCQLKPIEPKDYKAAPSAEELVQLQKIFPSGVCDYSKPGIGQGTKVLTWLSYSGDGQYRQLPELK